MAASRTRLAAALLASTAAFGLFACDIEEPTTGSDEASSGVGADPQPVLADPRFVTDPDCFGVEPVGLDPDAVECGSVAVPLHHDQPDGDTIELAVAILRGRAAEEHERPLMVLGGGPGETMVEPLLTRPEARALVDVGPDLIVVDQRGVGSSEPALECPEVVEIEDPQSPEDELDAVVAGLLDCRDRLVDSDLDLGAFNHPANAADVDLVRRALRHDQLDLRGTSYGTQVALLAAQRHPEGIGSVLLSSPVDPTRNWVELAPAGIERALDQTASACGADPRCSEAFGELGGLIEQTVDRLEADPEEVTVELPDAEPVTVTYTPARFVQGLMMLFYLPDGVDALPALTAAAAAGELEPLAGLVVQLDRQIVGGLSVGMQYSMLCTGEAALVTPESLRARTVGTPVEEYWIPNNIVAGDRLGEVCDGWDVDNVYDPEDVELDHPVPTLLVTGHFDHVTAPGLGRSVHEQLPNSTLIEVPDAGHGPLETLGPCGTQIAREFLLDPDTPPEDACATEREVGFVTGSATAGG